MKHPALPPHQLTPVKRDDRHRVLASTTRLNILYRIDGEARAARVPGSHFVYDPQRHGEHVYLFEDSASFRAWSNMFDHMGYHLYRIKDLPLLFTRSGGFFGSLTHVDGRNGLTSKHLIPIVDADDIDTGHVTFLDTETGHVTVVPTRVSGQTVTFDATSRWTLYQPTDDGTLRRAVLSGSHFLWYSYQLILITSHDDLRRAVDWLLLPYEERHSYLYPVTHLADVFNEVAPGTLLNRIDPDPASEEVIDTIALSGDRVVSFVPEGR